MAPQRATTGVSSLGSEMVTLTMLESVRPGLSGGLKVLSSWISQGSRAEAVVARAAQLKRNVMLLEANIISKEVVAAFIQMKCV